MSRRRNNFLPVGPRPSRAIFPLALLVSVLLHVLFFVALPFWRDAPEALPESRAILRLSLWEPVPEPEATPETADAPDQPEMPPEEMHLPRHTAETLDLEGTDLEAPASDEPVSGEVASGPGVLPSDAAAAGEEIEPEDAGELAFASEPDFSGRVPGGMQALDEQSMGQAAVTDPRSEAEARRMEMVNRYLARMSAQVRERWQMPADARAAHRGVIRMRVDETGHLVSARLHLPSGHNGLDESVLAAIQAVPRYQVPDAPEIVRQYYSNLRFEYSGGQ